MRKELLVIGMFPKLGAFIVWLAVAVMIAAAFCGCNVLPVRAIEVNVRIVT